MISGMFAGHSRGRRSRFKGLSHEFKFTANLGNLVPVCAFDVVPSDHFKVNTNAVVRFTPLVAPLMHHVDIKTYFFFVPNRIIWDNWENFITGGERGDDTSVPPRIQYDANNMFNVGDLGDYFGLPVDQDPGSPTRFMDALPFRAYNLIYNEFFRQQDIQDEVALSKADGLDSITNRSVLNKNWNSDYFTSCLPYAQKGTPVSLSLAGEAPVKGIGKLNQFYDTNPYSPVYETGGDSATYQSHSTVDGSNYNYRMIVEQDPNNSGYPNLRADLSQVSAFEINELRKAWYTQRLLERDARSGSRYAESIISHFGIRSPDGRLQRPEFLGGGRSPVVFSEVLQTSSSDTTTPQANMAGHGFGAHRSHSFRKTFTEHGWVIGLAAIMPKSGYMSQGIPRNFGRQNRFDYLWPDLVHMGERSVSQEELFVDPAATGPQPDFGFLPQYQEYRHQPNRVAGLFRKSATQQGLDFWHMARRLDASSAQLNSDFLECRDPGAGRIFAVDDEDLSQKLYCHFDFQVRAKRPLPKHGVPV